MILKRTFIQNHPPKNVSSTHDESSQALDDDVSDPEELDEEIEEEIEFSD